MHVVNPPNFEIIQSHADSVLDNGIFIVDKNGLYGFVDSARLSNK